MLRLARYLSRTVIPLHSNPTALPPSLTIPRHSQTRRLLPQKITLVSSRYPQGLDAVTVLRERCSVIPASLKQAYTHRDPSLPDRRP